MRNFSTAYKKKFKQLLLPLGYINKKSVFIKLEDDVFFVVAARSRMKGERSSIWTLASPSLYCNDIAPDDFDMRGLVDNVFLILQRIAPDKFTTEHYSRIIDATGEENTLRSLDCVCEVLEAYVLPYIHRFADLEYYYSESLLPKGHNGFGKLIGLSNDDIFFLSIKLRKYEAAMGCLDRKAASIDKNINRAMSELNELRNGNISEALLIVQKRKPDVIELSISAAEQAIAKWEKEIGGLQIITDALLLNDHNYLDRYIKEIENRSRESLRDMLSR